MTLAVRSSATALRLINKYGDSISITRVTAPGSYDPNAGLVSDPTTVTDNIKSYAKDVDLRSYGAANNLLLQVGDKVFLVSPLSIGSLPKIGDIILHKNTTYTIIPVFQGGLPIEIVSAQDTSILYRIHGRKS